MAASLPSTCHASRRTFWSCLALVLLSLGLWGQAAHAAVIVVTTFNDDFGGTPATCSLREAITAANGDSPFDGCAPGSGPDTILLPDGTYVLTRAGAGDETNEFGDLDIDTDITIQSMSGVTRFVIIDGNGLDRVFDALAGIFTLNQVTVIGGEAPASPSANAGGGAVRGLSVVIINECMIQNNSTLEGGGGVANYGTMEITKTTIAENRTIDSPGGGILQDGFSPSLVVTNSTISGNQAATQGGGIATFAGSATLNHVTITENQGTESGGGIFQDTPNAPVNFANSVIAQNVAIGPATACPDLGGPAGTGGLFDSDDHNVIGNDGGPSCSQEVSGSWEPNDQVGTPGAVLDALLDPLAMNGGQTPTHLPSPDGPAVDRGRNTVGGYPLCTPTDQRGLTRPVGSVCDVGAVEASDSDTSPTEVPGEGWHMLGIPHKPVNQAGKRADLITHGEIFFDAVAPIYAFRATERGREYEDVTDEAPLPGQGLWVKTKDANKYPTAGERYDDKSVPVVDGWNLVTFFEDEVDVSKVTTNPANMTIESVFYRFDGHGYLPASTLEPGKGYWVKIAGGPGTLEVPDLAASAKQNLSAPASLHTPVDPAWPRLAVEDANGYRATLYLSPASLGDGGALYDLPPLPPAGAFDVRFNTSRFVESIDAAPAVVLIQATAYPVTVQAENLDGQALHVRDLFGGLTLDQALSEGQLGTLNEGLDRFEVALVSVATDVETSDVPGTYTLAQNYPNPFNPSTAIRFALPEQAHVTLRVYTLLGEHVATLVDGAYQAGHHQVTLDASALASGTYLYTMEAGSFREVRTLTVAK